MISQVERGETSLARPVSGIAAGLELSLSQLLRLDESDGVTVVRAGERWAAAAARGSTATRSSRRRCLDAPRRSPPRARLRGLHRRSGGPADARAGQPLRDRGRDRWPAAIRAADSTTSWRRGLLQTFDADLPHHFENPGTGEARFYAVGRGPE